MIRENRWLPWVIGGVFVLILFTVAFAQDCDEREDGGCGTTTSTTLPDPPAVACPDVCPAYHAPSYVRCVWDKDHDTKKCSKRVTFEPRS